VNAVLALTAVIVVDKAAFWSLLFWQKVKLTSPATPKRTVPAREPREAPAGEDRSLSILEGKGEAA
jgi:hypothetical protein